MIKIYGLYDPFTGKLRYIGKTNQPLKIRLQGHMKEIKNYDPGEYHKVDWLRSLNGVPPIIRLIEKTNENDWQELEKFYISWARDMGLELTNLCEGGQGGAPVGHYVSDETKRKISETMKGRKSPRLGMKNSQSHNEAISIANTGRRPRLGHTNTEQHNEKIGRSNRLHYARRDGDVRTMCELNDVEGLKLLGIVK